MIRKRYRCARCGRTTFSKSKKVKCPRKKPQCRGAMIELGHRDHVQGTIDGKTWERIS